jgi:DNA-binding NarL/FixJ family response regulator
VRALWIEDHQLIAESLEVFLQVEWPEISLDRARDIAAASQLVRSIPYEVVLLDWWLSNEDGTCTIPALREAGCHGPIVVVSGDDRELVIQQALKLGAAGYVPKSADAEALMEAIRFAIKGGVSRPPPGTTPVTARSTGGLPAIDVGMLFPELTPRQVDVFRAMMRGLSDKHIARELGVSDTTVKTHVRAILQVVGVHKRGEAVFQARSRGGGA